jgi:hypothetical protein
MAILNESRRISESCVALVSRGKNQEKERCV